MFSSKSMAIASLSVIIAACSNGGSGGDNSGGSGGGASGSSGSGLLLDDGDVLGGGTSSIVRIPAADGSGIVRVNSTIQRQGSLAECSDRFADNSLVANSLIEACVSDQGSCSVRFQPIGGNVEAIPPPLYAPVGVEYQLSVVDRNASVTDPVTAVFCFDVGVNSPPEVAADTYQLTFPSLIERSGVRYGERCEKLDGSQGVLANDDDDEHITNTCLQAQLVEGPRYASNRASFASTFGSDGSFVYEAFERTPPEDANGRSFDSFTYVVTDGVNPPSDPVVVEVVFTSDNRAPQASDDRFDVREDSGSTELLVLNNDNDPDALPLTIVRIENGPGNGVATIRNGTLIEYRPGAGYVGTDNFRYVIEDSGGLTTSANVFINVTNVNDPPEPQNDEAVVDENNSVEIRVTANDSDPDNNTLTVTSVGQPGNGSAVVSSSSSVTYTPNAGFFGRDSFQYTVSDGTASATATVVVNVASVNVGPSVVADSVSVAAGESIEFDLLANDSDGDGDVLTLVNVSDPANGTVVVVREGLVRYTPDSGFTGQDQFSYVISDGTAEATGQANIDVSLVNTAPVAVNDAASTAEGSSVIIDVLDNDRDDDGDSLTVVSVSNLSSGTAIVNEDGRSITYTPPTSFVGQTNFIYTAEDGNGGSDTASVTVTIDGANSSPVAADDIRSTEANDAVRIFVLENDVDDDGDSLTIDVVTQPANGAASVFDDSIIYTPSEDFAGTDEFTYMITDQSGASDTATVTVEVTAVNTNAGPVAQDDSASTNENVAVLIPVTSNDSDPDGDALTLAIVDDPSNGVASLQDGAILYTPSTDFSGVDAFSYSVSDSSGASATATVTVNVSSTNAIPVAVDDAVSTDVDTTILVDVTGNDSDPDGDALTVGIVSSPANGVVAVSGNAIEYTPGTGFFGEDQFDYNVTDPSGASDTATVVVTVEGSPNGTPVAVDDERTTELDDPVSIGVLDNDSDPDGDNLTLAIVTPPDNGTATIRLQNNNIIYSPVAGFSGTDAFVYEISDGNGGSDTATVTITVSAFNAEPTALDDVAQATQGRQVNFNILANDTDPDGDNLTVSIVTAPTNGIASVLPDNRITYTPDATYVGADSIDYQVDDGNGGTDTANVSITVAGINLPPSLADDAVSTPQDTVLIVEVLANDTDPNGDTLVIDSVTAPAAGVAAINNNTIVYTPDTGFSGVDSFDYFASDNNGGTSTATVDVTVTAVVPPPANSAPLALADVAVTDQDVPVDIIVLTNDSDPEGDVINVSELSVPPINGTAVLNADESITYTPDAGFAGVDSFEYTITDEAGNTASALVEVTVQATVAFANTSPVDANTAIIAVGGF